MFALRRIAARAVFTQPARQLSTLRPAQPRTSIRRLEQVSLVRSFHQSGQWQAEEQKPAESTQEPVTTEPSAEEQKNIREESITTPDIVEASPEQAQDSVSQVQETVRGAAEVVQNAASSAAQTFSNAASTVFPPRSAPARHSSQSTPTKNLYVGNLFFDVTVTELQAEFARFGRIANIKIISNANGQSRGFGYVEFETQKAADKAVAELDQKVFAGRRMAVQYNQRRDRDQRNGPPRERQGQSSWTARNPPTKTLFIGNMSYQMSDKDLNDLFREIRNVLDVRVAIDRRTGQPRGFAHADFVDVASAETAKALLEQKVIYGRQLRIDYSLSTPPQQPL